MDTTEQKLAQALQREVHLAYSLESERRCNESLRAERDRFSAELTLAKQEKGDVLHELRSAVAVIEYYAYERHPSALRARDWLTRHAQQTKAPLVDPEAAPDPELEPEHVED